MLKYLLRRLLFILPSVFGVVTLVFLMIHLVPGDPVEAMLGEYAAPSAKEELEAQLGLDRPLHEQYVSFLLGVFTGDFGTSVAIEGEPAVMDIISEAYPKTMLLAFTSMLIALLIAIPAGIISAAKRNTMVDYSVSTLALLGLSIPNFWLGPLLILVFSVHLNLLPVSGFTDVSSLILPSIALGTALAAALTRMVRASMSEELTRDYIRTARAKGLSEFKVVVGHAFKNSLIPVVSVAGLQFGALLAGAVVTERIFSIKGLGFVMVEAITRRDYPIVQGTVLIIAFSYILINLATDLLYGFLDPRVRYEK